MPLNILILGGTAEARRLADRLAGDTRLRATLSLAGRTTEPIPVSLPVRFGGFGGVEGLRRYIADNGVDALVVATHPFAARIAANGAAAATAEKLPVLRLLRAPWVRHEGDDWHEFPDLPSLVDALGPVPRRVFVTVGRQEAHGFERAPQHRYLFRSIDPITPPLDLPDAEFLLARGPFGADVEMALMRGRGIEILVAKASGGTATYGKIEAARRLRLPVYLVARPVAADLPEVRTVDAVIAWLAQLSALRGE